MRAAAVDGGALARSVSALARSAKSLRGATGERREGGREGECLERPQRPLFLPFFPSPARSLCDHRPVAAAVAAAAAVLLSGVISWWESEVMAREVSQ